MFYYMEFIKHRSMELSTWDHLPVCMAVAEIMNRQKTSISISQYIIDTLWISNCVINFVVLSKTFNLKGTTIHSFSAIYAESLRCRLSYTLAKIKVLMDPGSTTKKKRILPGFKLITKKCIYLDISSMPLTDGFSSVFLDFFLSVPTM